MIWTMLFVGLGVFILATVPPSIAAGDPIWPWSLVMGAASTAFGLLIRWRGWV